MNKQKRSRPFGAAVLAVCLAVIIAALSYCAYRISRFERYHRQSVERWCESYGLDEYLIYAMIYAESGGDSYAVSHAGAVGTMQLMPHTAEWLARREGLDYQENMLLEPDYNIRLGCAYIKYLQERFQNTECVIAAYNAGPGAVSRWLHDPRYSGDGEHLESIPYDETREYVKRVARAAEIYRKLYPADK